MPTISQRELYRQARRAERAGELAPPTDHPRPQRRGDCLAGPRPCPYMGCRHHLLTDVTSNGALHLPHGDPLDAMDVAAASCALDVAGEGPHSLADVADHLNLTRERVRQIEHDALAKLNSTAHYLVAAPGEQPPPPRGAPMSDAKPAALAPVDDTRVAALREIDDRFAVGESVKKLRKLMDGVTEKEITPDTVNAACNCVSNINQTIRTAMQAAQFLAGR